jgi:hypothetical protein
MQAQTSQAALNQVELMKQFLGSWKFDIGKDKDTTGFYDVKSYGTGSECYMWFVTKGNIYGEIKQLCGYNKEIDKYFLAQMGKGMGLEFYVVWFISNTKYKIVPYNDLSNPEKASLKMEGEFNSPDIFVETIIRDNIPHISTTYTRINE